MQSIATSGHSTKPATIIIAKLPSPFLQIIVNKYHHESHCGLSSNLRRFHPEHSNAEHAKSIFYRQNRSEIHQEPIGCDREVESFKFNNSALLMRKLSSMNMTTAAFAEMNCGDTGAFMGLEIYISKSTCKGVMDR